jgi:hypothetical protein
MPVISALTYTVTDSTIVAVWTTDVPADSNLTAGSKAAIDNGVAASSTSHQCVVPGLLPNTLYPCFVTSGGSSSNPQNVRTNPVQNRLLITSGTMSAITAGTTPAGDTYRSFVSSDNATYMTQDDGKGFIVGSPSSGYNTQIGKISNETTLAGTLISLTNYGALNSSSGTDGPAGAAMSNKSTGLFGLNGNLHCFVYRQFPPTYTTNRYCNWIKSTDHGATWNNFTALSTFTANGNPVTPNSPAEPIQFYDKLIGIVTPVLYAADDGTLGYNTAGQQIDGGNAYVYCSFVKDNTPLYMLRIPRIQFDAQTSSAFEYWVGSASPAVADFVNDANWSSSPTSATNILPGATVGAWWQIAFVPRINSYIMTTWVGLAPGSRLQCYSSPTPAGPWTLAFNGAANTTVGSIWYGPFPFHRDIITNTRTDQITTRIVFQGESSGANYKPNWATLTLFVNTPTPSTNTFVQGAQSSTNQAAPYTLQYPGNVTTGNLLIAAWRRGQAGSITDVHDDQNGVGNPWTIVYDTFDSGGAASVYGGWAYLFSTVTSSTHPTVTITGAGVGSGLVVIAEYNGPSLVRELSAVGKTGAPTPVSPAITTDQAGDLLIGVCGLNTSTALTAGSGYVLRERSSLAGPTFFSAIEDNLNAAGGSITASFTATGSATTTAGIGAFYGFALEFTISGSAGVAGATLSYVGTSSGSVVADSSGNYVIQNLFAGSYTITPSLAGYTFVPVVSTLQTITNANITGVNFTATGTGGGGTGLGTSYLGSPIRYCSRVDTEVAMG